MDKTLLSIRQMLLKWRGGIDEAIRMLDSHDASALQAALDALQAAPVGPKGYYAIQPDVFNAMLDLSMFGPEQSKSRSFDFRYRKVNKDLYQKIVVWFYAPATFEFLSGLAGLGITHKLAATIRRLGSEIFIPNGPSWWADVVIQVASGLKLSVHIMELQSDLKVSDFPRFSNYRHQLAFYHSFIKGRCVPTDITVFYSAGKYKRWIARVVAADRTVSFVRQVFLEDCIDVYKIARDLLVKVIAWEAPSATGPVSMRRLPVTMLELVALCFCPLALRRDAAGTKEKARLLLSAVLILARKARMPVVLWQVLTGCRACGLLEASELNYYYTELKNMKPYVDIANFLDKMTGGAFVTRVTQLQAEREADAKARAKAEAEAKAHEKAEAKARAKAEAEAKARAKAEAALAKVARSRNGEGRNMREIADEMGLTVARVRKLLEG
jgi:predicted  nucleic acid-binding Zn-ribbon protein